MASPRADRTLLATATPGREHDLEFPCAPRPHVAPVLAAVAIVLVGPPPRLVEGAAAPAIACRPHRPSRIEGTRSLVATAVAPVAQIRLLGARLRARDPELVPRLGLDDAWCNGDAACS